MATNKVKSWFYKHQFNTTEKRIENLIRYEKATKSQKVLIVAVNLAITIYMLGLIARLVLIYPVMSDPARLYEYQKSDFLMYYMMKNYAEGDTLFAYSFMLLFCQNFATHYYSIFRLADDFSEFLFSDLPKLFRRLDMAKIKLRQFLNDFRSMSAMTEAIQRLKPYVQGMKLSTNLYLSSDNKAKILFIFRYTLFYFNYMTAQVKFVGFYIVGLILWMSGVRPSGTISLLIAAVDYITLQNVAFNYIIMVNINIFVCCIVSSIWAVSLLSNYRRFKQSFVREEVPSQATKLYSSMIHCQRIFVGALSMFAHMNRTIVQYSFTAQFCFAGLSTSIMIVGSAMQSFPLVRQFGLLILIVCELGFFMSGSFLMIIGGKLLYSHASTVRQCNVSLAKCPGMIYRKWKANTFLELVSRKRWSFSVGPLDKINSRTTLSCLLFYSGLIMTFIQQYQ